MADEGKAPDMLVAVDAVVGRRAGSLGQQALALVVADGLRLGGRGLAKSPIFMVEFLSDSDSDSEPRRRPARSA